jgi:hypothetical protein
MNLVVAVVENEGLPAAVPPRFKRSTKMVSRAGGRLRIARSLVLSAFSARRKPEGHQGPRRHAMARHREPTPREYAHRRVPVGPSLNFHARRLEDGL